MPGRSIWTRTHTWLAGDTGQQCFDLGFGSDRVGFDEAPCLGVVRAWLLEQNQSRPDVNAEIVIQLPDGQTKLGPIDVPCVIPVELPVQVYARLPVAARVGTTIVVSAAIGRSAVDQCAAVREVDLIAPQGTTPVPQGARRVSILLTAFGLLPPTWELWDATGTTIATGSAAAYHVPVPRAARTLAVVANGTASIVWEF